MSYDIIRLVTMCSGDLNKIKKYDCEFCGTLRVYERVMLGGAVGYGVVVAII